MYINFQWLMYPCILWFIYSLYVVIKLLPYYWGVDFEPLGTLYYHIIYIPQVLLSALLAFLFWKAFK
jgi:hypothetical protein